MMTECTFGYKSFATMNPFFHSRWLDNEVEIAIAVFGKEHKKDCITTIINNCSRLVVYAS